jgi:hypothetical protein
VWFSQDWTDVLTTVGNTTGLRRRGPGVLPARR